MKLCDYGCGREAKYPLKNGKWCCEKSQNSCPVIRKKNSESLSLPEVKKKHKLAIKEAMNQPKSKEKRSKIMKKIMNKPEVKINHSKLMKEIMNKPEVKAKHPKSHTFTIEQIQEKYPTFAKIEEMIYSIKEEIQVHCHNHNCPNSKEKGGWFIPNRQKIMDRIRVLEKPYGNGGSYFYCSEQCKQTCPSYNKTVSQLIKEDEIKAGIIKEEIPTGELKIFREEVLKRQKENLEYNECEYCGNRNLKELVVHHEYPRKTHPQFELDPDNGIVCCGLNSKNKCHIKYGHRTESSCSTGNLANKICI